MGTINKKSYLKAVAQKLKDPSTRRLLQFGQTWNPNATPIRDDLGLMQTNETIMHSASNMFDLTEGKVAFSQQFGNFSASFEDVADVRTIGAVDLTIISMAQSLIPFICMDRGMSAVDDTVYYMNLSAVNNHGNYQAGDTVWGNFEPAPTDVNLSDETKKSAIGDGATTVFNFALPTNAVSRSVKLEIYDGDTLMAIGGDFTGTNQIVTALTAEGVAASFVAPTTITFDRATGAMAVTFGTAPAATIKIIASATGDVATTQRIDDGPVLIVEPTWTSIPLQSKPHNVILQNNLMNMMYMNKVNALATGKAGNPYTDAIFKKVQSLYTESINSKIIKAMASSVSKVDVMMDASGYSVAAAGTMTAKNDLVCQTIANMKAAMLAKSGQGMTALVVNSVAAAMLECIPVFFVKSPTINAGLNGLIGYMMDIPVYRHNSLDHLNATYGADTITGSDAIMFGAYRAADNTSGSQIYGEYLPLTNTGNVSNYAMPVQTANGFFSMIAHKVVDPKLITLAVIKGNSDMFRFGGELKTSNL